MSKKFETCVWPGYWEGKKPVVNFKTTTQKLKFSFLQRENASFVCVFNSENGVEMSNFLDASPFTMEKELDSSGYYTWQIKNNQILALQHKIMRAFNAQ
jgi:hypothetical protein